MYFITIKRMLEVCFSAHPNIQYRALKNREKSVFWHGKGAGMTGFFSRDSHLKTVYIVPKIRYNSLYRVITQSYIKYEMKEY